MSVITTPAYLIHKQAQGDTSLRLYCFTPHKGLLSLSCRGIRTSKKRTPIEPFVPLWCTIHERRGVYYLNALETQEVPFVLTGISLFSALYLNELLFYILPCHEPEEILYWAYESTLKQLSQAKELTLIEQALRRFEIQLLKAIGYELNWQHDDAHQLICTGMRYCYQPARGFTPSPNGFEGDDLLAVSRDRFETKSQLLTAKRILRQAIAHLLGGRKLASRALLR